MAENIAIKVSGVSKSFKLPHEKQSSIKGTLINTVKGGKRSFEKQQVLKDISFEVKKGEFFGIVGRNGSGKSTMLKMLAGIYTPTKGTIQVNGKLTPFIELGVGFNPELTGRENVYLNGALLGFNRREMDAKYDEIVTFAELSRFMDQKLKNYSSGMQVRLAFSIAIQARTEILLIDEVLAVGDANFQQKCYRYFYDLKKNKQTVVLVTHDMGAVKEFCDRAVLIHDGDILAKGPANTIARAYAALNIEDKSEEATQVRDKWGTHRLEITGCIVKPLGDKKNNYFAPNETINIKLNVAANDTIERPIVGVTIKDMAGREVCVTNTKALDVTLPVFRKGEKHVIDIAIENIFNDGQYKVTPGITNSNMTETLSVWEDAAEFEVLGWPFPTGITHPKATIKLINKRASNVKKDSKRG
jgi:ABC-2 type transport system ATP-binding protein